MSLSLISERGERFVEILQGLKEIDVVAACASFPVVAFPPSLIV